MSRLVLPSSWRRWTGSEKSRTESERLFDSVPVIRVPAVSGAFELSLGDARLRQRQLRAVVRLFDVERHGRVVFDGPRLGAPQHHDLCVTFLKQEHDELKMRNFPTSVATQP